jgi:hypothetical protein
MASRRRVRTLQLLIVLALLLSAGWRWHAWSHLINAMLPADSRPGIVDYVVEAADFEAVAEALRADFAVDFDHVARFREAGIAAYEGPSTCLGCHPEIEVAEGEFVDTLSDVTDSVHYRFFSKEHPNVWGFNGELADDFAMGKINRPCPKPGSFAMTAWAEFVVTERGDTLSEGCGQCHIGGQYQAPLGEMMPLYATLPRESDTLDCLICHAAAYDMDRKVVVQDPNGRTRWAQDRSLRAALSVTTPGSRACLRCHQHNFGGDLYIDAADPTFMPSLIARGADRPRVAHPGSKRGTPFSPSWDVHAAAEIDCIDCHATRGHRIARGTHTTTIMANDLPGVEVGCVQCHDAPHVGSEYAAELADHVEFVACTTCHIPSLHEDNATRRDFATTEWEEGPGIHIYTDVEKRTAPGEGIAYMWWNGDATFLGNPVGDNPAGDWVFYDAAHRWPEFADYDYAEWYERVMRPIAAKRPSKLYAMKRFNGRQHIDLQNIGPFGGMFVPYDLPAYYRDGDPDAAARSEMDKSMMGMMYGWMFKIYMLDRFMGYMDIDGWNTGAFDDVRAGRHVEPRWIPTDAMLEISHAIRPASEALKCSACHPEGN